jgi:hypothetical protein
MNSEKQTVAMVPVVTNITSNNGAKDFISSVADTKNMDEANKKALDVLVNGTEKDFLKHMFTNQETGQQRSYAEMRMMYG